MPGINVSPKKKARMLVGSGPCRLGRVAPRGSPRPRPKQNPNKTRTFLKYHPQYITLPPIFFLFVFCFINAYNPTFPWFLGPLLDLFATGKFPRFPPSAPSPPLPRAGPSAAQRAFFPAPPPSPVPQKKKIPNKRFAGSPPPLLKKRGHDPAQLIPLGGRKFLAPLPWVAPWGVKINKPAQGAPPGAPINRLHSGRFCPPPHHSVGRGRSRTFFEDCLPGSTRKKRKIRLQSGSPPSQFAPLCMVTMARSVRYAPCVP